MKVLNGEGRTITFNMDQGHSCCGHIVFYGMEHNCEHKYVNGKYERYGYKTKDEAFKEFLNEIQRRLDEELKEYKEEYEYDDEKQNQESLYAFATMTLTENQIPDLIPFLLDNGWSVLQKGKNPKTDNIVYNLGKNI